MDEKSRERLNWLVIQYGQLFAKQDGKRMELARDEIAEFVDARIAALESESAQYREAAEQAQAECERLRSDLEKTRRAFCFIDAATGVDEGKSACDYAESFYPNMDEDDCLPGMAFSQAHKYAEALYEEKVWEAVIAALAAGEPK